jgi:hypothetical protein
LFALGGLLLLLRGMDRNRRFPFFLSGVLLGLAILMKQPGVYFLVLAALYVAYEGLRVRPVAWGCVVGRLGLLGLGGLLPIVLTCLALWACGVFDRFLFWTFAYATQYGLLLSLKEGLWRLFALFGVHLGVVLGLLVLGGIGLAAMLADRRQRPAAPFVMGLLVFSFLGVSTGLYWRPHYFLLMIPAVALILAVAVGAAYRLLSRVIGPRLGAVAAAAIFLAVVSIATLGPTGARNLHGWDLLFRATPVQACREIYRDEPFPESVEIARYLREHTSPDDRIAVLGSEPQIYFYAGRRSATGYIYTYGLMEKQLYADEMQKEMRAQIEAARPAFIVQVSVWTSWGVQPDPSNAFFKWADQYVSTHYQKVGVIDILSLTFTRYVWDGAAADSCPQSSAFLVVWRRSDLLGDTRE